MKLRKSEQVRRRSTSTANRQRRQLRNSLQVENLERREMLNADWTPQTLIETAWFPNQSAMESTVRYLESRLGDSSGGSSSGEGGPNDVVTAAEFEPNDGFNNAQLVPLAGNLGVNITAVALALSMRIGMLPI